jgi:ribonuclease HII
MTLRLAGVDEAGRGPLAGPVVAAAVILPEDCTIKGIADSKKLTMAARERVFEQLISGISDIGIGIVEADEIDRINILQATYKAMRLAVAALPVSPDTVIVDGLPVPHLHRNCQNLIKGDALCPAISAASIIAKVTRDRLMCGRYHEAFPEYNFAQHKGYGTPEHLAALQEFGPCPIHRRSFAPVGQCLLPFNEVT